MLVNWQRIEQVIKWTGAASVSAFAREIGLNRAENLYQIKRGNNGISRDLAESVTAKYPQISKAWLLTGEGEMLPGKNIRERYDIPFFKADITTISDSGQWVEASSYISLPMFKGCDLAAFSFSDAMAPEIPKGAMVLMQESDVDKLAPGGMYFVKSLNFTGIRNIRQGDNGLLRLVPKNTDDYDEMVISRDEITQLFRVRGIVIDKTV